MIASDLVNHMIPQVDPKDSISKVLRWMEELELNFLPVVDKNHYMGLVEEDMLLEQPDDQATISGVMLAYNTFFIDPSSHFYEAIGLSHQKKMPLVPVVENEKDYIGVILQEDMFSEFCKLNSLDSPGSIIELEMKDTDYSITELGRIIESNGVKILSLNTFSKDDPRQLTVILKLNKENVQSVLSTLERYEYKITSTYKEDKNIEKQKDRLNQLLRYLDI